LADASWLTPCPDGVDLVVHARPGARRSAVAGLHGAALGVRLAARPVDGAANLELVRLLADALGVSRSAVTLESGARGHRKRLHVAGLDVATARARLAPYLSIDKTPGRD
jgi:uncharacterized protein (TIGR00251 family)